MKALRREAPLLLLLLYGGAFAYAAFGHGVPAFDDHPGQLFRLWHALDRSLPAWAWTADWNPDWWGGYPELQFYPPGFAILGALIRAALLWRPSVEMVYRLLAAVTFLAPGLATYALLVRVIGDRWLALPGAFLALVLSADLRSGVEAAIHWGSLTTRLAVAWLPLLALALRPWVTAGRTPIWAPPIAAIAILCHPSALAPVLALVALAAALALLARPGRPTMIEAGAVVLLPGLLGSFWAFPLVVRHAWIVPLSWSDLAHGIPGDVLRRPVLVALGIASLSGWIAVLLRRRPFDALLATMPLLLGGILVGDLWLFVRGWSFIEPARLADGVVHACVWATTLGLGVAADRFLPARGDPRRRPLLALLVILVVALLPDQGVRPPTVSLWPDRAAWPTVDAVTRAHQLDRLWTTLRAGSDRVLFLTSSVRLGRDPAWYAPHSHIMSLTPLRAGREIVHGTYTHPSPIAARFYSGQAVPPARIDTLVERLDGHSILGVAWEQLPPETFDRFARRLRIATVVVPAADAARARFLRPAYGPAAEVGDFVLFERRERPWPRVERITPRRYRVLVSPTGGVWIPSGILAYPLWQVKSAAGRLETRADEWGFLEFRVPVDLFEAEMVYSEGWPEWLGLVLSAAGGGAWIAWTVRARASGRRRPP